MGKTEIRHNLIIHHFPFGKEGRFAEKSDLYLQLVKKELGRTPSDILYPIFLAVEYAAREQYNDAISTCLEALKLNIDVPLVYLVLAQIYRCMGHYQQSIEHLHKSLSTDTDRKLIAKEIAFNLLAMLHFSCGNLSDANEAIAAAIEINPHLPQFYLNSAIINGKIGNFSQAQTNYFKACELNPMLKDQQTYSDMPFDASNLVNAQLISPVGSFEEQLGLGA